MFGWLTYRRALTNSLSVLYSSVEIFVVRDFGTSPELYEVSPGWFNDDFVEKDDQDSVVGTATPYGLDVSRLEPRRRRVLPQSFKAAVGYTLLPVKWVPFLFLGDKATGAWR
jgi:hypothetical protein